MHASRILPLISSFFLWAAMAVHADTLTVTNTLDDVAAPPVGSLRHVVVNANSGDTIEFAPSVTGTITLGGAELIIDKDLTINGPGASVLAISGNNQSRIVAISAQSNFQLSGLTLRNGQAPHGAPSNGGGSGSGGFGAAGGCILNSGGNVRLSQCTLINNRAGHGGTRFSQEWYSTGSGGRGGDGGAIYSQGGELHLSDCSLDQNAAGSGGSANLYNSYYVDQARGGAGGHGGGIYIAGSIVHIERCSITNSVTGSGGSTLMNSGRGSGGAGGGSYISHGQVIFKNCTISGNRTGSDFSGFGANSGGGLAFNSGTGEITSCTISNNSIGTYILSGTPATGGGIRASSGSVTVRNSIIAGNRVPTGAADDVSGAFVSGGHNLIGNSDGSTGFTVGANADLVGTAAAPIYPSLLPLANNGGPTQTHALLDDSPALEAGDDSLTGVDQRGFPRLLGSHVDIGALESELSAERITFFDSDSDVSEGAGNVAVRVLRQNPSNSTITVQYTVTTVTAIAGSDFNAANGTLEFLPGQLEKIIVIPILDDTEVEAREFFDVSLSSPSPNVFIGWTPTHTVTIVDNDGPGKIEFSSASTLVSENGLGVAIKVTRKDGLVGTVSASYATMNGTAVAGVDYLATGGVVTFPPGITEQTITIPLLNDEAFEFDETFTVRLSSATGGATIGIPWTHTVTIQSDDAPPTLSFSISASLVSESAGSVAISVTRSGNSENPVSVSYHTSSGSATSGSDFTQASGILTFDPSDTEKIINVPIAADGLNEGLEAFQVTLSNASDGAVLGSIITHNVSIVSPDGPATISFLNGVSAVSENAGFASVALIRNGTTNTAPTVRVKASSGSARAGADFDGGSQEVLFPVGATQVMVQVKIVADRTYEGDETFTLQLSDPQDGGTLGGLTSHTITILNDDAPAAVRYRGLAERTDAPGKAGIALTKTAAGKLTGSMRFRGKTLRFHAKDVEDQFIQIFPPSPKHNFAGGTLGIHLGETEGASGSFVSPDGAVFQIDLKREKTGTAREPVAETGYFTAVLDTELEGSPAGFLAVKVLPAGRVTLKGMLPDGTRLASSSHMTEGGMLPVFIPAYAKSAGYLGGNAEIEPSETVALSGDFVWLKPPATGSLYPAGLDHVPMQLTGNFYSPPQKARILDDYNTSAGALRLQANSTGELAGWETSLVWDTNNQIRMTAATLIDARITLLPRTGLFSGTFKDEGERRKFHGICVQQSESGEDLAAGFYIGETISGRVELQPED